MNEQNTPKNQNPERANFGEQVLANIKTDLANWACESLADGKVTRDELFKLMGVFSHSMYKAWENYIDPK